MFKTCKYCKTLNRKNAVFCKRCGKKIVTGKNIQTDKIIDRDEIKNTISVLVDSVNQYRGEWNSNLNFNINILLTGNTGTGKNLMTDYIIDSLISANVLAKDKIKKIEASDNQNFLSKLPELFKEAKSGAVVFENFHRLIPTNTKHPRVPALDQILNEIDKSGNDPVVIIHGDKNILDKFILNNPAMKNRFEYYFRLQDYSSSELYEICRNKLEEFGLRLEQSSAERLLALFKHLVKTKKSTFGNGYAAVNTAEDIVRAYYYRVSKNSPDDKKIRAVDIIGDFPNPKTLDEIFAEIDELIGLETIKAALRDIASQVQHQKNRIQQGEKNVKIGFHLVLTGNPGTGKTMIARKLGDVLAAIGFLDKGHVVETDKSSLVGRYVGETPYKVTKKCDEAMGGVLFIDEAYALAQGSSGGSSNQYGKEAIETILKRMEDDRDKFVVVAAGYRNEMERFLNSNPGLKSRFDRFIHIDDYTSEQLTEIFRFFVKKNGYKITEAAMQRVAELISDMYNSRSANFANAREVRRLFEQTIINLSKRVSQSSDDIKNYSLIVEEDFPPDDKREIKLEDVFDELDKLVGLDNLKIELKKLAAYVQAEEKRKKLLGEKSTFNLHFVFMGNPGTGKTTVARLLGKIFKSLGILSRGHLVEVDRSDLVAGFVGQTSSKTDEIIDSAMGGILFIDEAYSLVVENSPNDFGQQAIQILLKRMEDDGGKFIVVAAGYPDEMQNFIESNPGLESRFKKKLIFKDYNGEQLYRIFKLMVDSKKMRLSAEAELKVKTLLKDIYENRGSNFGNGRTVRNLFENCLENQSFRIAPLLNDAELKREILLTIEADDIKL
ncbi:stage V sporulation protein K [bacterium BMS3Abin03]|nr:stage V sporulation protein K [bacterium BMS3Abin03]